MVAGGAAMLLAYGLTEATHDVDAVTFKGFAKIEDIKPQIQSVAKEMGIAGDWINPHFGGFSFVLPENYASRLREVFKGKTLEVWVLGPEDLLIMKLHAGRPKDDSHIRRLLKTQALNLQLVESHLEDLIERGINGSQEALSRYDQFLEDLGLD